MSVRNYISLVEKKRIDGILADLLLTVNKSYPEDSLIDITKSAVPGIQILEHDFDHSIRGAIYKQSPEYATPKIVIRKSLTPEQKTFALAHELGHYQLDHPGKENFMLDTMSYDGSKKQQLEAQAQYFAASLLMPESTFVKLAKLTDDDAEIAKVFGVTPAAVSVRRRWLKVNG